MTLFPDINNGIYTSEDAQARKKMCSFYNESLALNQEFLEQANIDLRFYVGDSTVGAHFYGTPVMNSLPLFFNKIQKNVDMISGYQRRNRSNLTCIPVDDGDQQTADQMSKLIAQAMRGCNGYNILSDIFQDALVTGISIAQIWQDFRDDPISGDIKIDKCSYNSFLIDPYFKKRDLSDCNAIWKRSYLTKEACASLMPSKKEIIYTLSGGYNNDKFPYMPENSSLSNDLLSYDEFYYRTYRKRINLIDVENSSTVEWAGNEKGLKKFLEKFPNIQVQETMCPTVNLSLLVAGKVLYDGRNPLGIDSYPFVPVITRFNPELEDFSLRIRGIVRAVRDSQYIYNELRTLQLNQIKSQSNSGYMVKETNMVNIDELLNPEPGKIVRLKKDAQPDTVQLIPTKEISQSILELTNLFNSDFPEITGATDELLGESADMMSGIALLARQKAGLTTLQPLFDALDSAQSTLGVKLIEVIQKNYVPSKVERILNEKPTQEFYDRVFKKYDCAVTEGYDTATQKEYQYMQLLNLKANAGIDIPDEAIINAAPIQDKKKLLDIMAQQAEQAKQQAEKKEQAELAEQMATVDMIKAQAAKDRALGSKYEGNVKSGKFDMLYKTAEAARKDQELQLGALDSLRKDQKLSLETLKTLDDIRETDIARLEQLLEFLRIVKNDREQEQAMSQEQEVPMGPEPGMDMMQPGMEDAMMQPGMDMMQPGMEDDVMQPGMEDAMMQPGMEDAMPMSEQMAPGQDQGLENMMQAGGPQDQMLGQEDIF